MISWMDFNRFMVKDCLKDIVLFAEAAENILRDPLCEKCPNTEFFMVYIFLYSD